MAGNTAIQILRGTNAKIAASTDTLAPGQLLYNEDKNFLTCGNIAGTTKVNGKPIAAQEVICYSGDGDTITSSTMQTGYIKSVNNKLSLYSTTGIDISTVLGGTGITLGAQTSNVTMKASNIMFAGQLNGDQTSYGIRITPASSTNSNSTISNVTPNSTLNIASPKGVQISAASVTDVALSVDGLYASSSGSLYGAPKLYTGAEVSGNKQSISFNNPNGLNASSSGCWVPAATGNGNDAYVVNWQQLSTNQIPKPGTSGYSGAWTVSSTFDGLSGDSIIPTAPAIFKRTDNLTELSGSSLSIATLKAPGSSGGSGNDYNSAVLVEVYAESNILMNVSGTSVGSGSMGQARLVFFWSKTIATWYYVGTINGETQNSKLTLSSSSVTINIQKFGSVTGKVFYTVKYLGGG